MTDEGYIKSKQEFKNIAGPFLKTIFFEVLKKGLGDIEIRHFQPDARPKQYFCSTVSEAVEIAYDLGNAGIDTYFGVNPRIGRGGTKDHVHYLTALHAEVDYGAEGHKKKPIHTTYDDAIKAVCQFALQPTLIVHSGGGFHCYWVLNEPVEVKDVGVEVLENINKTLCLELGGDSGTHDLSRVLRVPGTFNFKLEDKARKVTVISAEGPRYDYTDFERFIDTQVNSQKDSERKPTESPFPNPSQTVGDTSLDSLPVSDRIKSLIQNGNDGTYPSRSEADQAVVTALVNKGMAEADITTIFQTYPIGEKYREHNAPETYLTHTIEAAKDFSDLTEEERLDPLFISRALHKENDKYHLRVVSFQEFMVRKYSLRYLEKENAFFRYNDKCYEYCTEESLNHLCQSELKHYRHLFTKPHLKDFIHFCIGDKLVDSQKAHADQIKYLTLQNGLYDLDNGTLTPHTPDSFTTNLLPYDYDPTALCSRFLQYLDEVFLGDDQTIGFIQEAIGYAFHKAIPKPAMFFLIGSGSNGKSVFIDTITNLIGEENACSISLNSLSNEYYVLSLFGKMINISSETPHKKYINTDLVKAAVGGDWITGRVPYKQPMKFKPFAKHFLAMNETPLIEDTSHGMWRRVYVIQFPRTFSEEEMDVYLTEKLEGELSGMFNWAMAGYKRLRAKNFIFSEGKGMKQLKHDYKRESSSVLSFAAQELVSSPDNRVKFGAVYEQYKEFCEEEGYTRAEKKSAFRKTLETAGYVIQQSTKDNNQLCIFDVESAGTME